MLSGGEEASLTFTYIDFEEVDEEKLEKLQAKKELILDSIATLS